MRSCKFLLTMLTLCLCFAAKAKDTGSAIIIANIGPQDAWILPVTITTSLKCRNFSNDDSLANLIYRLTVTRVENNVYKFIEHFLAQQKCKVDTLRRFDYEAVVGSCSIVQTDAYGKHYLLLAYKAEAISILEQLVYQLKHSQRLNGSDVATIVDKLSAFIAQTK